MTKKKSQHFDLIVPSLRLDIYYYLNFKIVHILKILLPLSPKMKKKSFITILLTFLFLLGTIGIDVNIHYCSGDYIGFAVNGIDVSNDMGETMEGCMNTSNDNCGHCKLIVHQYHIDQKYTQGQSLSVSPLWHTVLPASYCNIPQLIVLNTVEEGGPTSATCYVSPFHPVRVVSQQGLRAPPSLA